MSDNDRPRRVEYKALSYRVLAAAKEGYNHDWTAYIKDVPGHNYDEEQHIVLAEGDKLSEKIARAIFPEFNDLTYRM